MVNLYEFDAAVIVCMIVIQVNVHVYFLPMYGWVRRFNVQP